jgi:anti-sigma B factor antagonist
MLYSSAVTLDPPDAHLVVAGELDAFSATHLRRDVDSALVGGSTDFTVDAGGVTFVDAAGLGAFVRLRNATAACGGSLTFVAASTVFVWVCRVAGLAVAFDLDEQVAELPA